MPNEPALTARAISWFAMVTETLLRDLKTQTLNPSAGSGAAQKTSALGAAIDRSTIRQRSLVLDLLLPPRDFVRRENWLATHFCDK
jgi:hypothetical protein